MEQPNKIPCPNCGGTKHCTSCNGTGIADRLGVRIVCPVCLGNGRCLPCGGSGEIEGGGDPPISTG